MSDKVEKLLQRAQLAIAQRDWDKAKQGYLMALAVRGDLPDVHYGLATVYFQLRELTSAAHHFREVVRLDPLRAGAHINLGAVLNLLTQYDEAVTALRRGLQLDNGRVEGYYNLGLVYKRKGQPDLAITAYKEAIRLNPRMADAHLNLANLFVERGQHKVAVPHYEEALKLRPGWEKAADGLEHARNGGVAPHDDAHQAKSSGTIDQRGRVVTAAAGAMDNPVDPIIHGAFLSSLNQAAHAVETTGNILHTILTDELEPVIKELSHVLMNARGSRSELDGCLGKFETALSRMRTAQKALKSSVGKVEEIGEHIPAK